MSRSATSVTVTPMMLLSTLPSGAGALDDARRGERRT